MKRYFFFIITSLLLTLLSLKSNAFVISITKIESNNDFTTIHFNYVGMVGQEFNFGPNTHLLGYKKDNPNVKRSFNMVKIEGIPNAPEKYRVKYDNEQVIFKIIFKKVDSDIDLLDIIECDPYHKGCFNFHGIKLFTPPSYGVQPLTEEGNEPSDSVLPTQLLLDEADGFMFEKKSSSEVKQTDIIISKDNKYLAYLPIKNKKEDGSYDLVVLSLLNKKEICSVNIKDFASCQLDFEFSSNNDNILFLYIKKLEKRKSECCVYNYDFFKVDVSKNLIIDSFAWEDEINCLYGGSKSNFFKVSISSDENILIKFQSFCEDKNIYSSFLKHPSIVSLNDRKVIGGTDSYLNYKNLLAKNELGNADNQIKNGILNEKGDKYVFEVNRKLYIMNTIGIVSEISKLNISQHVIELIDFKNNIVTYKTNNVNGNYLDGKDEIWGYNTVNGSSALLKVLPLEDRPKHTYQVIDNKIVTKFEIREPNYGEFRTQFNFYTWTDTSTPYLTLKVSNSPICFFSNDLNFMYFLNSTTNDIATQLFVANVSYDPNQQKNRIYEVRDYKKYANGYEPLSLWKIFKDNVAENRRNSISSSRSDNSGSSSTETQQKKDECEEAENMDIPLENLSKKLKKEVETDSKITYVTEIDGWNAGTYWYDKDNKDYYIDSGNNKHHYGSLDDCLRALYIYKKAGGCITKKGKK